MHPYLIRNIGPPSSMFHHHRVPLFAFQSFICPSHVLTHSCASLPLKCKCSAHLGLSTTITALAVYQAWLCPQVWCCLIHREGFSLLDSSENYPLIGCVHHANPSRLLISHELASSWNNTFQVYVITSLFGTVRLSRHGSHTLQWKTHRCMLNVLSHGFLSACQIR